MSLVGVVGIISKGRSVAASKKLPRRIGFPGQKFLPGVRIRDQNNESHPPHGQTLGLGERQEGVKLAAVVGSLIELDLRCSQHEKDK